MKYQLAGIQGRNGVEGNAGPQGPQGATGPKGQRGERGQAGLTGPQGSRGVAGSKGQKGEIGLSGLRGSAGSKGQKGEKGRAGTNGLAGSKGQKGESGVSGPPGPTAGGVVYTRWGKTTCSNTSGAELLYAGRAAGSFWSERGGGANYLCLPEQPQYSTYTSGSQYGRAYLYGAEYHTTSVANGPLQSFHDHNVPCAVCYTSTRETVDDSCTTYLPIILDPRILWLSDDRSTLSSSFHI